MSFLNFIINTLPDSGNNQIYSFAFHDILRIIIIQVTTHILFHLSHNNIPLLSRIMIETMMFAIAGVCVYWFCFYTIYPIVKDTLSSNRELKTNEVKREKIDVKVESLNGLSNTNSNILSVDEELISLSSSTNQTNLNKDNTNTIEEQESIIEEDNNTIGEQESIIEEDNNTIGEQESIIEEDNNTIEEQESIIEEDNLTSP
jgi:sRNA-binding regulator protein Hfq